MGEESTVDDSIARAMDRVLESERAAQDAVTQCRSDCEQALEQAREQRLHVLDRAQVRVMRLRQQVAKALEPPAPKMAARAVEKPTFDSTRFHAALERLAAQLTGSTAQRRDDEP